MIDILGNSILNLKVATLFFISSFALILFLNIKCKTEVEVAFDISIIDSFLNSKEYAKGTAFLYGNKSHFSQFFFNQSLGQFCYRKLDYKGANLNFHEAIKYCLATGDTSNLIKNYGLLVASLINSGSFEEAKIFLGKIDSLAIFEKENAYYFHRLMALWYYFNKNNTDAKKYLDSAILYLSKDACPDKYLNSKIFDLAAMNDLLLLNFDSALNKNEKSIQSIFNNVGISFRELNTDINSAYLVGNRAQILASKGFAKKSLSIGIDALNLFYLSDSLLNCHYYWDNETFIQNNFYHNNLYSYIIKHLSWLFSLTKDKQYLIQMLNYIGKYKSKALRRDINYSKSIHVKNHAFNEYFIDYCEVEKICFLEQNGEISDTPNFYKNKFDLLNNLRTKGLKLKDESPDLFNKLFTVNDTDSKQIIYNSFLDSIARIYFYLGNDYYNKDKIYIIYVFRGEINLKIINNNIINYLKSNHLRFNTDSFWVCNPIKNNELFKYLFDSVYSKIKESKYIKIVPDNFISLIPFEAFIIETNNSKQPVYLIDKHNIFYSYTINEDIKSLADNFKYNLLGLGYSDKVTLLNHNQMGLTELPQSYLELKGIENEFLRVGGNMIYTGKSCTFKRLIRYGSDCKYLHLAIHGERGTNRLNSKIYLRSKSEIDVDTVYAYQLLNQNIKPDLVVLSTCEAGTGSMQFEEGQFSMCRSFIGLGANYVISSDGVISDNYSKEIFIALYHYISKGCDYIFSLAQAKRDLIKTHPDLRNRPQEWDGISIYHH